MAALARTGRWWLPAALAASASGVGLLAGIDPAAAILVALSVGFVFVVLANLYMGLLLFTVLTFAAQVPTVAGSGLTFAKLAGLLLAISWLAVLARREDARPEFMSAHPGLTYAVVAFLAWAAITGIWAEDSGAAFVATSRLGLNAILFLIIFTAVRTRAQVIGLVAAFVLGASLDAVYGMLFAPTNPDYAARLGSSIDRPGELAAALVAALVLTLGLSAALRRSPIPRILALGAAGLCAAGVFLTGSRGGLIALGVALAAFIAIGARWRGRIAVVALVVALAAVGFFKFVASSDLRAHVSSVGSGSGRLDLWTVGWRMVEHHPVQGIGAGNFPISSVHYVLQPGAIQRDQYIVGTPKVAHNTYLEIWAEDGLVGLLLFGVIVGFCLRTALRAVRAFAEQGDVPMELIARALFVALCGFLAGAFFTSREYAKDVWLLLGLAPALLAVAQARVTPPD